MSGPAILHHRVIPSSSSEQYNPNQTVDFHLQVPGRKIINGSVRIEGTVSAVNSLGDPIVFADSCKLDAFVGAHAFLQQMSTEVESKGMIETLQQYPRYVSVASKASMSQDDTLSLNMQAELRCGGKSENGKYALQRVVDRTDGGTIALTDSVDPSFSIKPMVAINRASGNNYSFDRLGFMRISAILSQSRNAMFGLDGQTPALPCTYTLSNLAIRFSTVPEDGDSSPMLCRSYFSTTNSISSTNSSLVSRVPSTRVNGVTVAFIKQADSRSASSNTTALQSIPQFISTEYLFQNSVSGGIEYVINDEGEAIQRGIDSLSMTGHSNVSTQLLQANDGFLLGFAFDSYLDMSQSLFSQRLVIGDTSVSSSPYDCHSFFHAVLEM